MLAVIRLRFPATAATEVWSDVTMNNWLNPSIPYSLAHFWTRSSLFQADLSYFLFPAVTMADPRSDAKPDENPRTVLVDGVLAEVTRLYSPDWSIFKNVLIVGAQQTDQFGGGGPHKVGNTMVLAAVVDVLSPFSNICQELGHAFGLEHELNTLGDEYQSPYSVMSSELYGGDNSSFEWPADPRLPIGKPKASPNISNVNTNDVQRIVGPYITPAQFSAANMGSFNDANTVHQVPPSFNTIPHTFRLTAYDAGMDAWPNRKVILAVVTSADPNADTYYLELRRNRGYDANFSVDDGATPPIAVVIHAYSKTNKRIRYVNRIPLFGNGDSDYHDFNGRFVLRIGEFDQDFSSVTVTVSTGETWKYFGVGLDDVAEIELPPSRIDQGWQTVNMSPCFMFPIAPHQFRNHFHNKMLSLRATSFGYEQPMYSWFLNDQLLEPANHSIMLQLNVKTAEQGAFSNPKQENITFSYDLKPGSNKLKISCDEPYSGISAIVKVMVSESSHEVLQNLYPDRSLWTSIQFNNVTIEHDQGYVDEEAACAKRIKDLSDQYAKSRKLPQLVDPGPRFGVDIINVINALVLSNPTAANAVINEVARIGNVGKKEVIGQLN
jgi:hypothetical protein